jgi:hypothetical protein
VKLREHRLMTCRRVPNWPPKSLGLEGAELFTGEQGFVKHVLADRRNPKKCFLIVEQNGIGHVGLLEFDDLQLCARIAAIIGNHLDRPLSQIGDIDLDSLIGAAPPAQSGQR